MKYVSFTFDDGRRDNFTCAYPVMKKYGIPGTLFCTTGYIDGTWQKDESWHSAGEAIHVDELKELQQNGWEIALHGDKHTTEVNDLKCASQKMTQWGFSTRPIGFSMPNSNIGKEKLDAVVDAYLGSELLYIRAGRKIDTKSLSAKILFALYTYGHMLQGEEPSISCTTIKDSINGHLGVFCAERARKESAVITMPDIR